MKKGWFTKARKKWFENRVKDWEGRYGNVSICQTSSTAFSVEYSKWNQEIYNRAQDLLRMSASELFWFLWKNEVTKKFIRSGDGFDLIIKNNLKKYA